VASTILLKAAGLITSPNLLDRPDGALSEAKNIIIKRDGIIEPSRGFKLYGTNLPSPNDRVKQLTQYRNRILRHYGNVLQYDDGSGNFSNFSGTFTETQTGLRVKSVESNGNYYFTTNTGIKKISARNGADLDNGVAVTDAGGIKAVDMQATSNYIYGNQTGFLPQDSAVAYRVVWASKDLNNNLVTGTPSQRETVYNYMTPMMIQDFLYMLVNLDNITDTTTTARISDGNYTNTLKLPITASATELRTNLISLCSKLDNDIFIADQAAVAPLQISSAVISSGVCTVTFSSGDPTQYWLANSKVFLAGFAPATGTLNGAQTLVTVTSTTIAFNTSATGAVTLSSATIYSNEYRSITQPSTIDIPTPNQQLVEIQNYMDSIIQRLQSENVNIITLANATTYIDLLDITTSSTVDIAVTIPEGVTENHFMQVYRSSIAQAELTTVLDDLTPSDELQLVYEAYPTSAELSAGEIIFTDETPDEFRGANLYTNAATGEGITQANDIPPFAKDINRFRNSIFYANTRTRHRLFINLLGVQKIIDDYNSSLNPVITIANGINDFTYSFILGIQESVDITCTSGGTISDDQYFDIPAVRGVTYRVWYDVSGSAVGPTIPSGYISVKVRITNVDTATQVADKTRDQLSLYVNDFEVSSSTGVLTVLQTEFGYVGNYNPGTVGFTGVTTEGQGEDAVDRKILLSNLTSPARSVDATARSLVRIINKNDDSPVYAYYLSGAQDVPGKILLESKDLSDNTFYVVGSSSNVGSSFNPNIEPNSDITAVTTGTTTTITNPSHGLVQGDYVLLTNTDATPLIGTMSPLDGLHQVSLVVDSNNFVLNISTSTANVRGSILKAVDSNYSENEIKVNRVYYSKFQQPEAVPITNYFDVGATDKEILRIFPLRDSLFVFKEDGLYRISGEFAPFNVSLFDSSCILKAPDSVSVANNLVYSWTTQGIVTVTESGVQIISRVIDNQILKLASANYTNFKTATWGVGYESDNSYTVWTVSEPSDEVASIAYRYSNLTNTWTTLTRSNTCGIIFSSDDKMYIGAGDTNYIEQERKNFDRTDYSNREVDTIINNNKFSGTTVILPSVTGVEVGDAFVQTQYLTIYEFNSLLKTLDNDPGIVDNNFFSTLEAVSGNNLRSKIEALATKLDNDTGVVQTDYLSTISLKTGSITATQAGNSTVITSSNHGLFTGRIVNITGTSYDGEYSVTVIDANNFSIPKKTISNTSGGTFETLNQNLKDIEQCYNKIVTKLNADTGVSFSNYMQVDTVTLMESIITNVNKVSKTITLNKNIQYTVGDVVIFKAIKSSFTYNPNTMGDPLSLKHAREATLMFNTRAVTSGTLEFSTDLLPAFIPVNFDLDGNGIFGSGNYGAGFFGGASNAAPFRTYIPRNCQRCRYISVKFSHTIARESYDILGTTITAEVGLSTRAYK